VHDCSAQHVYFIELMLLQLFQLLTSENNSSVFSSIDRTIKREIVSETSRAKVVYLEQAATVGALMFKKHFTTACYVTEYAQKLSADFSLAKPGIMASFQVCSCAGISYRCPLLLLALRRCPAQRQLLDLHPVPCSKLRPREEP
jgi:hypothetical protein